MRLTDRQKEFFVNFGGTEAAKELAEIVRSLMDEICDIRNIGEAGPEVYKARVDVVKLIEGELVGRMLGKQLTKKQKENYT